MKLFHRKFGQGKPLFILHGLFGSGDNWQTLAKSYAEHFEVYVIDQRNHGQSPHSNEWTYTDMVNDLLELMDDNHLETVSIIGHSMGGKAAMYMALKHPSRIEKLIVVDIAPKYYPPHHSDVLTALNAVPLDSIASRKEAELAMAPHMSDPAVMQFLLKNLYWKDEKLAWRFNLKVIENYIVRVGEETLPDTNAHVEFELRHLPVLFIRGANSKYILDNDLHFIEELFPAAHLVTIPNASHWVQAEQPVLFLEESLEFLISIS